MGLLPHGGLHHCPAGGSGRLLLRLLRGVGGGLGAGRQGAHGLGRDGAQGLAAGLGGPLRVGRGFDVLVLSVFSGTPLSLGM